MFKLGDNPWIQQRLRFECIYVPSPDIKQLQQWCPHVRFILAPRNDLRPMSDRVVAFGLLILQLEAGRKASWTTDSGDWIWGEQLNQSRLAQVLYSSDWEGLVVDRCRRVAKACLEFDCLIESMHHQGIDSKNKGLGVMYKYVVEPLYCHIGNNYSDLIPVVEGMFDPYRRHTPDAVKQVLFDDDDSIPEHGAR